MSWISVLILIAVVWLAVYVLAALMAQYRQELMDQYIQRRNREALAKSRQERARRAAAEPIGRFPKAPPTPS